MAEAKSSKHPTTLRQIIWPAQTTGLLESAGLDAYVVKHIITLALDEDLRWGPDVTTQATAGVHARAVADVVARKPGIVAGIPIAVAILTAVGMPEVSITTLQEDGSRVAEGDVILRINGSLRKILSAERTLLNFLTHLSGIATSTRIWVDVIAGTNCKIRDTRKTTPGLRALEKYAVRCGGGMNHRMGLGDAALIKDNHVIAAGGVTEAIKAVRQTAPMIPLEVECDTLSQVKEALTMHAPLILLDNMSLDDIRAAVILGQANPETRFEASGGLYLDIAKEAAETGVDFLAIGALTHSSPALDIALDISSESRQ